jgi:hypothetical protein
MDKKKESLKTNLHSGSIEVVHAYVSCRKGTSAKLE